MQGIRPVSIRIILGIITLLGGSGLAGAQAAFCEASVYGVSPSAADNTAALTAALQACHGRTLHLSAGTYLFAPGQFVTGFFIPDATSIVGDGAASTILEITGPGNYDSFFWIRGVSHVSIRSLTLRGNGTPYQAGSCTYDYGRAISISSEAGQSAPVTNIWIASNLFQNFTGSGWIQLQAAPGSPGIGTIPAGTNVTVDGNFFQSAPGDSPAPGNPNCNSSAVQIFGAASTPNITNVSVSSNGFDASYLKQGIIVYGSAQQVTIAANSISNTGQKLALPKDSSLYGIIIYQKSLPPNTINVLGNIIPNAFSCGVYVAAGRNITISGNQISGQIDSNDDIEPKGAICLNQIDNGQDGEAATISGNSITQSHVGLAIYGGSVPNVLNNTISLIPSGGAGIKIVADKATSVALSGNSISTQASQVSGLLGINTPTSATITDLFITGAAYPARWYRDANATQAICQFGDVGSVGNILARASPSQSFSTQGHFSVGCQ